MVVGTVIGIAITSIPKLVKMYIELKELNKELSDEELLQKLTESEAFAELTHNRIQNID